MNATSTPLKCLVCGAEATLQRGLCSRDYQRFRRAKMSLPKAKQAEFDRQMIAQGLVAPNIQDQRNNDDPFKSAADELK